MLPPIENPMELATLSKNYGDFYAPAFAVRVGRDDLMRDLLVAVSQVEVDLVLGAASRFTLHRRRLLQPQAARFKTGRGDDVLELLDLRRRGRDLHGLWRRASRCR